MTGNRCGAFDLLQEIGLVYIGISIGNLMVVRIYIAVIILYLDPGCNSFRTKRCLVTSSASSYDFGCQVNRIGSDYVAQHLNKIGWLVT